MSYRESAMQRRERARSQSRSLQKEETTTTTCAQERGAERADVVKAEVCKKEGTTTTTPCAVGNF